MATHRIHVPDLLARLGLDAEQPIAPLHHPQQVIIEGEEAKHAIRVKRLQPGQRVVLFDAAGTVAWGSLDEARRELIVTITHAGQSPPLVPAIHLYTATPKGSRLDKMIDQLSQAGVCAWTPIATKFGVVDPRETRLDRMERITVESAKQAGRARVMQLGHKMEFHDAIESATSPANAASALTFLCDGSGDRLEPPQNPEGLSEVRVFIGPEGGFTPDELDHARRLGVPIIALGPTVLRIETAAVVSAGLLGWATRLREADDTESG